MASAVPFLLALFLTARLPCSSVAQPIPPSELADLKDLLRQIENKVELAEKEENSERVLDEVDEEPVADTAQLISSWDGQYSRRPSEGSLGRAYWQPPERAAAAAVRNRLGGVFNAPRRSSNCFGQRLDRIGSMSGLGCNRRHK